MFPVVEFGFDSVPWGACTGLSTGADFGVRTAALDHEAFDHAMEGGAIVELLAGELEEVLHGARGNVGPELDGHVAVVGVDDGTRGAGSGGVFHLFFVIAGGKGQGGHDGHGGEQAQA